MPSTGPVLLVYWNPYGQLREAVARHLDAVAAAADSSSLVPLNAFFGAPAALRRLGPSAVVLHNTFLGARWLPQFERWRARSRGIGQLDVPVIALPQDDYDHAETLDEWLDELGATAVLSPLASYDSLYPRTR